MRTGFTRSLIEWLKDDVSLSSASIFPNRVPERDKSADTIVVIRDGVDPQTYLDGQVDATFSDFDFEIRSESAARADDIAETIKNDVGQDDGTGRTGLHGFSGVVADHEIYSCVLVDEDEDYEPAAKPTDRGKFLRVLSFEIQHSERPLSETPVFP